MASESHTHTHTRIYTNTHTHTFSLRTCSGYSPHSRIHLWSLKTHVDRLKLSFSIGEKVCPLYKESKKQNLSGEYIGKRCRNTQKHTHTVTDKKTHKFTHTHTHIHTQTNTHPLPLKRPRTAHFQAWSYTCWAPHRRGPYIYTHATYTAVYPSFVQYIRHSCGGRIYTHTRIRHRHVHIYTHKRISQFV